MNQGLVFNIVVINNAEIAGLLSEIYDYIELKYNVVFFDDYSKIEAYLGTPISIIVIDSEDTAELRKYIELFRGRRLYKLTPVLLLTSSSNYKELQTRSTVGSVDHLEKPFNKYTLAHRIIYNLNLSDAFRVILDQNRVFKSKLTELEKLRISNLRLSGKQESLEKVNNLLAEQKEEIEKQRTKLLLEKKKYENLLQNVLPEETSRELLIHGEARTQAYKKVSVLFSDFVGFTNTCENLSPEEIVRELHAYFSYFDDLCEDYYVEKIKTIGDAYMCAGGLPMRNNSNPVDTILVGMKMLEFVAKMNKKKEERGELLWNIRIGIHTGPIIAGVIGKNKFAYDIWGDTVNTAARMETASEAGRINISGDTFEYIKDLFDFTYRGKVFAKHKGEIDMYFINGLKPEYAKDGDVYTPNKDFIIEYSKL